MSRLLCAWILLLCWGHALPVAGEPAADPPTAGAPDTLVTAAGVLVVHPFGHASLALEWRGRLVAVDPVAPASRWSQLPRPDLILITHRHGDHFDADTVRELAGEFTWVITTPDVAESIPSCEPLALANGDSANVHGIGIRAVPAANRSAERRDFHPRGRDNGYLLDLGGLRVFISGDTEDLPEHAELGPVDVAFLAVNQPYTMTLEQAAAAARAIRPGVLYPYHYRNRDGTLTEVQALRPLLEGESVDEVRILDWY